MPSGIEATMPTIATTSVTIRPPQSDVSTHGRPKSTENSRRRSTRPITVSHTERTAGIGRGAAGGRQDRRGE